MENLLEIKLKDLDSVPEIWYEGEKIKDGIVDINYHWHTREEWRQHGNDTSFRVETIAKDAMPPIPSVVGFGSGVPKIKKEVPYFQMTIDEQYDIPKIMICGKNYSIEDVDSIQLDSGQTIMLNPEASIWIREMISKAQMNARQVNTSYRSSGYYVENLPWRQEEFTAKFWKELQKINKNIQARKKIKELQKEIENLEKELA